MVCLLTVGGGITAGLTYYGPHHTRASDSLDPNETNKTKTIVTESKRRGVAISLSFAQVQAGGRIHLKPRAEGWRHAGLTINGEQLPNGGHFTLAGEGRNVVLVKKSAEPLIRIRNAKRFTLENVTLDANGQSGPLIVIEGKAEGVTLKDLDLRNSIGDAIQFIGAQGNSSDPVKLSNVSVDAGSQGRDGLPIAFRSNALQDRSRNIEIVGCRLTHNAQTGILIGQPVENLMIRRCTIVGGPYGIRFTRSVTRSTSHGQVIRDWQTSDWQVADGKITTPEKSPKLNWQSRSVVEETVTIDPEKGKPYGFAHALFHSNREGARRLTFGCNVACSVWVNDRKVLEHDGAQDYVAQAFTCVADFQKGTNHVVLRLRHEGRPAKFAVRVAEDASSLTLADWRNVTIDESVIEKARQSIVLMDVPTRQSKIQVQGTKFIDARHYPILVRLGETGLPPKVIEGIDNVDSEPHQARALTKDSVAYDLIPLQ